VGRAWCQEPLFNQHVNSKQRFLTPFSSHTSADVAGKDLPMREPQLTAVNLHNDSLHSFLPKSRFAAILRHSLLGP
jgi:hypothetical protein